MSANISQLNNIKVSVIVPVYNAEKFLKNNLYILCQQTLQNIEYIFINDASTDNSIEILKEFKEALKEKVVVINSEKNGGPGGARNLGIAVAKGEYIGFMDQDDIVLEEMYEELYNEAVSGDYDIVSGGYYNKKQEVYWGPCKIKGEVDIDKKVKLCNDSLYIWNRIYKKSLIGKMSMLFRKNTVNDDVDFCIEAYLRAEKVSYIDKMLYYYSNEGETLSRPKKTNLARYVNQTFDLFNAVDKRIRSVGMENFKRDICHNFAMLYARSMLFALFSKEDFSYDDYLLFDKIVKVLIPDYYIEKSESDELRFIIFNQLESDKINSYNNLINLKNKILSGEFDKEMYEKRKQRGDL